ncbi:MAG: hypothetical protein GHCLOJNM_02345 [bacterium]|nr:hypothetical protein [bacterium]
MLKSGGLCFALAFMRWDMRTTIKNGIDALSKDSSVDDKMIGLYRRDKEKGVFLAGVWLVGALSNYPLYEIDLLDYVTHRLGKGRIRNYFINTMLQYYRSLESHGEWTSDISQRLKDVVIQLEAMRD